ncbi:transcription factor grauzone-like isoform X2 [Sitodiplosis mosellana]|uniref:transcription factor grauzone-like isoform X2 n=1 Tax=Sitodiplosis mosellana TaxID=263140 RepID=UPI0024439F5A|nr:transcription factor grauzone-like isoform X2 [Sitodiplosis mosellana]
MEVKKEPNQCRLCYTQAVEYFDIIENSASMPTIVDSLKQYFHDEVNNLDILPKIICIECWDKVESFRKFSEEVIALREEYLRQHLNSAVKDEDYGEYAVSNIEPVHQEMVCVDPLRPVNMIMDEGVENMALKESKLHYGSGIEQGFSVGDEDDGSSETYDELIDRSELPESGKGIRRPRNISEVSPEQQQQTYDQYCDMSCDYCDTTFGTFEGAIQHYKVKHNNQPKGYVKCCSMKWLRRYHFHSHIVWHLNPELFKCQICGEVKKTYQSYQYHKFKHFNQFTCDICQKVFTVFSSLEYHILNVHATKVKFPCDQCDQSFKSRKHLEFHLKMTHSNGLEDYINQIKYMEFNTSEVRIKSTIEKYFDRKCEQCDVQLDSITMARIHYSSEHKNENGYLRCCGTKMYNKKTILDHVQWHIDPDTFRCRVCKLEHMHRHTLVSHVKRHNALSSQQFICNICDRYFATNALHRTHMELKHPGTIQPSSSSIETNCNENNGNDIGIPSYVDASCDLCSVKTFTSFKEMQSHYLDIHKLVGSVSCCQTKFSKLTHIRDHIAWHNNPDIFRCDVCNKSLPNRYSLKQHNDWHSNKYYCDTCQKSFKSRNQFKDHLKLHKNRNSEKQRNFICVVCDKGFRSQKHLNNHRRRHDLQHDQICEVCAKTFKTKAELKAHQETHTSRSSKPKWQCNVCNGWYSNQYKLAKHKLTHDSEPQKCNQCDKISPNPNALKQHIRMVHCELKFKCHLCEKSFKSQATLKKISTFTLGPHRNASEQDQLQVHLL